MTKIYGSPISGATEAISENYNTTKGDRIRVKSDITMTQGFGHWWNNPFNAENEIVSTSVNEIISKQPDARVLYMKAEAYEFRYYSIANPMGNWTPINEYNGVTPVDGVNLHLEIHLEDVEGAFPVLIIMLIIAGIAGVILLYVALNVSNQAYEKYVTTVEEHPLGAIIGGGGLIIFLIIGGLILLVIFGGSIGKKGIVSKGRGRR